MGNLGDGRKEGRTQACCGRARLSLRPRPSSTSGRTRTDVTEVVAATAAGHGESTLNLTDISYSQRKVDVDHENDLSIILYLPVLNTE